LKREIRKKKCFAEAEHLIFKWNLEKEFSDEFAKEMQIDTETSLFWPASAIKKIRFRAKEKVYFMMIIHLQLNTSQKITKYNIYISISNGRIIEVSVHVAELFLGTFLKIEEIVLQIFGWSVAGSNPVGGRILFLSILVLKYFLTYFNFSWNILVKTFNLN